MKSAVRALERAADWLLIALFLLVFALILAQVVCRYAFNSPLVWSEELARLAFVWLAMLAWSLGSRRRSHIAITVLADLLPPWPRLVLAVAVQGAIAGFAALLAWYGTALTLRNLDLPTVTLGVPYAVLYGVVPVAALAVAAYAAAEICALIAAGPSAARPDERPIGEGPQV
jgi:TRAP-type C4-dicarboxylate transport system permease small subunit